VRGPPEHVRLEVAAGEIEEQQAVIVILNRMLKERETFLKHHVSLSQIFVILKDIILARIVIFLKTSRVKQAQVLRDVLNKCWRLRYLYLGCGRIDIDWCNVKLEIWSDLLQIETTYAADMLIPMKPRHRQGKVNLDPWTPLSFLQNDSLLLDFNHRRVGLTVTVDLKLDLDKFRLRTETVKGTVQPSLGGIILKHESGLFSPTF